ncbi:SDR family NAD(P)-dependent oxidoreductase [Natrinema sp. 1APR25-10V2]|uniref:SDR family NAD(P)-dependent oxidoreductase n=1 Tax=Natrinema sp. 1APR25-10V2 TaxID=2951081 RepID=UPI0028762A60|nr:SDR family NAD(P)-dependent oxidoreductase [Natrinema sp. 1APR25-10V2]MDS0477147.1 SDR family NAD(P)-dependent oxidoreductase [Natrinema sp. 1APR25-10V2]
MRLEGKTAIVAGGSSSIGKAIAAAYVDEGAEVVIANRTGSEGEAVADELCCEFVQTDVSEYYQIEALVEATVDEFGTLDVLVNNAGIASETSVEECGEATLPPRKVCPDQSRGAGRLHAFGGPVHRLSVDREELAVLI